MGERREDICICFLHHQGLCKSVYSPATNARQQQAALGERDGEGKEANNAFPSRLKSDEREKEADGWGGRRDKEAEKPLVPC